ncbi:MAG: hypothetical protein WBF93_22125 [Pirellulales bacterium]
MHETLQQRLAQQHFANGYELVNGIQMHAENSDNFQIPHPVLKKHVGVGDFVELRIDSPRFSVHDDAVEKCYCPTCNREATKPILGHEHPATLLPLPMQDVPSRGWGEDFWVQVSERDGTFFKGVVDNPLYEARLHELHQGDSLFFHEDHILSVHGSHREEIVLGMDAADLKTLAHWLGSLKK